MPWVAGGCRVRQVVNEEELMDGLRAAFSHLPFRPFDSASMPILEQVAYTP